MKILSAQKLITYTEGEYTVFKCYRSPYSYRIGFGFSIFMAFPAFFVGLVFASGLVSFFIVWFTSMVFMGLGLAFFVNLLRVSSTFEFRMNEQKVKIGNREFYIDDIHQFYIKRPKEVVGHDMFVVGYRSVAFNILAFIMAFKKAIWEMREIISRVDYKIYIDYHSKKIALAKGLSNRDAEIIFQKIVEVGNLKYL